MKNRIGILFILAVLAATGPLRAQEGFHLGVTVGMNIANSTWEDVLDKSDAKKSSFIGYQVSIIGEYGITDFLNLKSALSLSAKGSKFKGGYVASSPGSNYEGYANELKATLTYLNIPVQASFKIFMTPGSRVYVDVGPYFAFGIGGQIRSTNSATNKETEKVKSFSKDGLKVFDPGLTLGAGFEFGRFIIDVNYDLGLVDISRTSDYEFKNRNLGISMGYKF